MAVIIKKKSKNKDNPPNTFINVHGKGETIIVEIGAEKIAVPKNAGPKRKLKWIFKFITIRSGERCAVARWIGDGGNYTITQDVHRDKYTLILDCKGVSHYFTACGSYAVFTLKRLAREYHHARFSGNCGDGNDT